MKSVTMLSHLVLASATCLLSLLSSAAAIAQDTTTRQPSTALREDFSDEELSSFVRANDKVMEIQVEGEQIMIKAIEDEGLTVERFNQILEQQRDPQLDGETSVEELSSFNNAAQQILQENSRLEKRMESSIVDQGIDVETYKQILLAYQQIPSVKDRVNRMVERE